MGVERAIVRKIPRAKESTAHTGRDPLGMKKVAKSTG